MASDLIICDSEYAFFEKSLYAYLQTLQLSVEEYCNIMEAIIHSKADDSQVTKKLYGLQGVVKDILEKINPLLDEVSGIGTEFISRIDAADSFIY